MSDGVPLSIVGRVRIACLALLLVSACTGSGGTWPSLAHRNAESGTGGDCNHIASPPPPLAPPPAPVPVTPPVSANPPAATVDVDALAARFADAERAWEVQRTQTEAAVEAAAGAASGNAEWAAAELELTRLERSAAAFGDISDRLGVVTSSQQAIRLRTAAAAAVDRHYRLFNDLRLHLDRKVVQDD